MLYLSTKPSSSPPELIIPPPGSQLDPLTYLDLQEILEVSDVSDDEFEISSQAYTNEEFRDGLPNAILEERVKWGAMNLDKAPLYHAAMRAKIDQRYAEFVSFCIEQHDATKVQKKAGSSVQRPSTRQ